MFHNMLCVLCPLVLVRVMLLYYLDRPKAKEGGWSRSLVIVSAQSGGLTQASSTKAWPQEAQVSFPKTTKADSIA